MSYFLTRDALGRYEIGDATLLGPAVERPTFIGGKKVPFRVENNKKLGGIFDPAIADWKAAQRRLRTKFPFRIYMLARLSASEYGDGSDQVKTAVQHAALNWESSNRWGMRLEKMLIPDGKFGGQAGRYASTDKDAELRDVQLAAQVLAGKRPDPTEGAIQWDAPRTQKILSKQNPRLYKPPEQIAKDRKKEGLQEVYLSNEDPALARFWRPTYVAQL
jgi:hypothetical protein